MLDRVQVQPLVVLAPRRADLGRLLDHERRAAASLQRRRDREPRGPGTDDQYLSVHAPLLPRTRIVGRGTRPVRPAWRPGLRFYNRPASRPAPARREQEIP